MLLLSFACLTRESYERYPGGVAGKGLSSAYQVHAWRVKRKGSDFWGSSSSSLAKVLSRFRHRWLNNVITVSCTGNSSSRNSGAPRFPRRVSRKLHHPKRSEGKWVQFYPVLTFTSRNNPRCDSPHHVNITALLWAGGARIPREAARKLWGDVVGSSRL